MSRKVTFKRVAKPEYDKALLHVVQAIRGIPSTEIMRRTKGQVSDATVNRLRKGPREGGTKWPRHYTLERIMRSVGLKFVVAEIDTPDNKKSIEYRVNA
jgi:hypothetical protein